MAARDRRIEKLEGDAGAEVAFTDVLMTSDEGAVRVGTPLVAQALANAVAKLTGKRVRNLTFSEAGVEFG